MTFPAITALLSVVLCLFMVHLIFKIVKIRRDEKIELQSGESDALTRAVRAHGNLVETAPIFLIMLGLLELGGGHPIAVGIFALIFIISRIMHPIGLSGKKGTFKYRTRGMILTLTAYILTGAYLVVVALMSF
ncbi:MAG: MAPEG family protein [Lentilitoribacter sp.]